MLLLADFHNLTSRELRLVVDLPDTERAHLIDLWLHFDDLDHMQTLISLRNLELYGTIYAPDDDEIDGEVSEDGKNESEEHAVLFDGTEYKYSTDAGEAVLEWWRSKGCPIEFCDNRQTEWNGIRVVAVLDENGEPLLLWDMVSVQ